MFVKQFRYSIDNLGYMVCSTGEGIAIDAGSADEVLSFAQENHIDIKYVSNTHSHADHTPGNRQLLEQTKAEFIDCRSIKSDRTVSLNDETLTLIHTPGHTDDSICFVGDDFMITGDTLFNGTVGNCFTGDLDAFFRSLKRLISFPGTTKVYGGHDYVVESMGIAKQIEENNPDIGAYLEKYDPTLIVSTLEEELKVNPYIRFNARSMMDHLQKQKMPDKTELERFKSIMEIF